MTDPERAFLDALHAIGASTPPPASDQEKEVVAEAPPASVTAKNIWHHPDAHPIALDMLLLRKFGPEWLGWEPETLQLLIPENFGTSALSDLNLSKLQACKVLHLVDSFWQRWEVFVACAMPLNGVFPDFQVMQVPTVAQCMVACDIAKRIRDDVAWSDELKAYVGTVYRHDGIFFPLPPADFATFEVPEAIDQKAIAEKWPSVRASGVPPKGQTVLDEQLRRLLVANGFLEESRLRLQQQLRLHA